jgi:D-sedoheptulose 7-phosphate isomerase
MFRQFTDSYFRGLAECYAEVSREKLERVVDILLDAHRRGRRFFLLGNGGSASTASHMACDFGKTASMPGKSRLRVISLVDNMALLSAWANDSGYEVVFKEQLENLLEPDDVVLGISASGNSPNVLRAMEYAKTRGAITIGFIGCGGGKLKELVDVDITVSSRNFGQVEDLHLTLNHVVSQYLKERIAAS